MKRDEEIFVNLVIPIGLLGDVRLTFLERLLLIDIFTVQEKRLLLGYQQIL